MTQWFYRIGRMALEKAVNLVAMFHPHRDEAGVRLWSGLRDTNWLSCREDTGILRFTQNDNLLAEASIGCARICDLHPI